MEEDDDDDDDDYDDDDDDYLMIAWFSIYYIVSYRRLGWAALMEGWCVIFKFDILWNERPWRILRCYPDTCLARLKERELVENFWN
jgi:hypothetical protein